MAAAHDTQHNMDNIQIQIDLTNILLALVAIVALVAAWVQLQTMQMDSKTQIGIARQQELATRASVLLSLDERFATSAMLEARNEMGALITRINQEADKKWSSLDIKERRAKSSELYPIALEELRTAPSTEAYGRLMVALSFFETVGYVTYSKYIPIGDVIKLFGPTIRDAGVAFEAHIRKLREVYNNEQLYDNFSWLIKESRKASPGETD